MDKGVFVKDMVMPTTCALCEFGRYWDNGQTFCGRYPAREATIIGSPRPDWCPLTADVRPVVRGEWSGDYDGYADGFPVYDMWSCSHCGKQFDEWDERPTWNYCPNCGADMREE